MLTYTVKSHSDVGFCKIFIENLILFSAAALDFFGLKDCMLSKYFLTDQFLSKAS